MRPNVRIDRGAKLLDLDAPGWENRIDLNLLDMNNSARCVLGQSYGTYYNGLRDLDGEAGTRPARYGFYKMGRESWESLTAKWKQLIEERRAAA